MTILQRIMELLKDRELTSLEVASKLEIPKGNCASYLNTLYKDGRIIRTTNKRPFKYKIAETPIELLRFSNNFFKEIIDYLLKNPKISEYILNHEEFDKIEDLVK